MNNRRYCIYFQTKNHYQLFENMVFKNSSVSFKDVLMINHDVGSDKKQLDKAKDVCAKYGIHWMNEESVSGLTHHELMFEAIDWLEKNNHDFDWIIRVHDDAFPKTEDFWNKLDDILSKHEDTLLEKVGSFGFADSDKNGRFGRGCLEKNIISKHGGWYVNLPKYEEYKSKDYFVVESPLDWAKGYNIKLMKEHIKIDKGYHLNHADDDISHQFMLNGIYNICFPNLTYIHDIGGKRKFTGYSSMSGIGFEEGKKRFAKKWNWPWGAHNGEDKIRKAFSKNCQNKHEYNESVQKKIFGQDIYRGPKTISYYEGEKN
jgi:hypothetical protein